MSKAEITLISSQYDGQQLTDDCIKSI